MNKPYYLLSIYIGNSVLLFLISIILARVLNVEEFGEYMALFSSIMIAIIFSKAGWVQFLVRELAALKEIKKFTKITSLFFNAHLSVSLTSIFAALGLLFFLKFTDFRVDVLLGLSILISVIAVVHSNINEASLRGYSFQFWGLFVDLFLRPALYLSFILVFSLFGFYEHGWNFAIWAFAISAILTLGTSIAFIRKLITPKLKLSSFGSKFNLNQTWLRSDLLKISWVTWLNTISAHYAIVITGIIVGSVAVANLKNAMQLSAFIALGLSVANALHAPRLSAAWERKDMKLFQKIISASCNLSVLLAVPIAVIFVWKSELIITIAFGKDYLGASPLLMVLVLGQIVNAFCGSAGIAMIASKSTDALSILQTTNLALLVGLTLVLAPKFGATGMAAGLLMSTVIWNISISFYLYKKFGLLCVPNPKHGLDPTI